MGVSDSLSFGHDDQVDESPYRNDEAKAQRCDLPGLRGHERQCDIPPDMCVSPYLVHA